MSDEWFDTAKAIVRANTMSIMRCDMHNRRWDSDKEESCPLCFEEELDAYSNDANREMGLPEDADFGGK